MGSLEVENSSSYENFARRKNKIIRKLDARIFQRRLDYLVYLENVKRDAFRNPAHLFDFTKSRGYKYMGLNLKTEMKKHGIDIPNDHVDTISYESDEE